MREDRKRAAIVVAGDRGKSHPVFGKNKAFLTIEGVPVVRRVVSALDVSESVAEIYVVGPKDRLEAVLPTKGGGAKIEKPVHIFEQRNNLYENVWHTFLETLTAHQRGDSEEKIAHGPDADSVILVAAADMPLLSNVEVDEFASKCDMENFDYVLGVTPEEKLSHYYASDDLPGIHMAYIHFREGNLRQNNLHMVRPFKIENRRYIQTMYDLERAHQKELGNAVSLAWEILNKKSGGWGILGNYLLMQLSLIFSRLGLGFLSDSVRDRTSLDSINACISKLLKTRFTVARTSFGGATLDIDCESDYEVIQQRFSEWMSYQEQLAKEMSSGAIER